MRARRSHSGALFIWFFGLAVLIIAGCALGLAARAVVRRARASLLTLILLATLAVATGVGNAWLAIELMWDNKLDLVGWTAALAALAALGGAAALVLAFCRRVRTASRSQ